MILLQNPSEARYKIDGVSVFCAFDEIVDVSKLKENPRNPNSHPTYQIELLGEIIKKTGWRSPITVSNLSGLIVKGHGRLQAAQKVGLKHVPVEYQNFKDEEEELAALLADNKIAELAEIDVEKLTEMFNDIEFDDLSLTGYSQDEYDELVGAFEEAELLGDADEVPEEVETRCKLGDVWQLGNHRLMCGDSTCFADVEKLMDGAKADMVAKEVMDRIYAQMAQGNYIICALSLGIVNCLFLLARNIFLGLFTNSIRFFVCRAKDFLLASLPADSCLFYNTFAGKSCFGKFLLILSLRLTSLFFSAISFSVHVIDLFLTVFNHFHDRTPKKLFQHKEQRNRVNKGKKCCKEINI